ncbi:hypothetical protein FYJ87_06615 [Corynebacterium urealyticum]|uniref:ABC transporter substrate-binding protein n=1 Tax=Corynebacterium urealyticum TaxID=43771 RepID=A0A5D4FZC4_9CORY|nr:hypothetical protein FYJ87_06615 [Corynebacterium urealyticum]
MFFPRNANAGRTPKRKRVVVAGLALALVAPLSSCAEKEQIVIGVPDAGTGTHGGQRMEEELIEPLAQEYVEQFEDISEDTPEVSTTQISAEQRIDQLREGKVSMTFGCVGELLDVLDPAKGRELREMYAAEEEPDRVKWRDITHSTMLSALPSELAATHPGAAVICEDDTLPQNIVALWAKPQPDRYELRAANNVAGGVSTEKLRATAAGEDYVQ